MIEHARKMTRARSNNHPWLTMDDEELLRSAGLILLDHESRREGITLAAIKDTTIMSALPQHKTDMIFRVQNLDRYDDRDVIVTNLLDSYERMSAFAKKHLNDPFVSDGMQSVSAIVIHDSGKTAEQVAEIYTKIENGKNSVSKSI